MIILGFLNPAGCVRLLACQCSAIWLKPGEVIRTCLNSESCTTKKKCVCSPCGGLAWSRKTRGYKQESTAIQDNLKAAGLWKVEDMLDEDGTLKSWEVMQTQGAANRSKGHS
jgi:hypothetical protein